MNNTLNTQNCQNNNLRLSPYQQALEHYACDHAVTECRYKTYANGTHHFFEQCLNCGQSVGSAIAHKNIADIENIAPWDSQLENAYQFLIDEMTNQLRDEQNEIWQNRETDWDKEYSVYLQSPQWKDKRHRVLERDGYLCQACLKRRASEVHHTTYQFALGQEPLFILVSVCRLCHNALHELNANSRTR